jgi:hypothetical protein
MKILFKFPTRNRPEKFFQVLDLYFQLLSNEYDFEFVISCDIDDKTMNNTNVIKKLKTYRNLTYYFDNNKTKIDAINANLQGKEFDILILCADDMIPKIAGFDVEIIETFKEKFKDGDGVLWFFDGHTKELNTMPIIDKKYYDRFGYIYYPEYRSFWCDNEFMDTAEKLNKQRYINKCIIEHQHPAWCNNVKKDQLYIDNDMKSKGDKELYLKRKNLVLKQEYKFKWSILIPTLRKREKQFNYIFEKLQLQINRNKLEKKVEIATYKNEGEISIGLIRNKLIEMSQGEYISFFDDDDDCHENYISMIFDALKTNPDVVSLEGIITFNGQNAKKFIHSIDFNAYFEKNKTFYRPPNHLNTIKSSIVKMILFKDMTYSEDTDFAMRLCNAKLLKTEIKINEPYYFYKYCY